jgi:predicted phosphodiesterase
MGQHSSSRRKFIQNAGLVSLGWGIDGSAATRNNFLHSFSQDQNQVRIYSDKIQKPVKIIMASDTHLWMDDARGDAFRQYSGRMAKAYNQTKHFITGEATDPNQSFQQIIQLTNDSKADLLTLPGDIFSFPSEAAIDWSMQQLASLSVPFQYTAGNHDWHYEGMEGSLVNLRKEWSEKRLKPLYQKENPLMSAIDINGVRIISIDNSVNEILPEQLQFFKQHVISGKPLLLFVHIPLYAPGRKTGFGCGHPDWGWDIDKGFEIERRERWPKSGHTKTTMDFHQQVFNAPNLLGVFAGHIHRPSMDVINGIPQFVTEANATGAYLEILVNPV